MKSLKVLFAVTALSVSGLVMAEGGGDRTVARIEQARLASMEAYRVAQQRKDGAPLAGDQAKPFKHANC